MTSGWSALILCIILGNRVHFGPGKHGATQHGALHDRNRNVVGGLVRVQRRQRGRADVIAANAYDHNAGQRGRLLCLADDGIVVRGKPSVLGFCSGAVAGLVVITPACGFVTATGAVILGVAAGLIPWFFCYKVKGWFGYDDALDTFGVHAIGGTIGAFLTGCLARNAANGNLATNLKVQVTDSFSSRWCWNNSRPLA